MMASELYDLAFMVNRSSGQTQFLYELCGRDFEKLKKLEVKIKNCFVSFCPGSVDEVEKVLSMEQKSNWFELK